ncbi:MAG: hypothetical protein N3D84_03700 [Candidatus Woesearchaeota archaeon]|nr:hypothetical protein [Candidatus Woesearchaeota archaeon]
MKKIFFVMICTIIMLSSCSNPAERPKINDKIDDKDEWISAYAEFALENLYAKPKCLHAYIGGAPASNGMDIINNCWYDVEITDIINVNTGKEYPQVEARVYSTENTNGTIIISFSKSNPLCPNSKFPEQGNINMDCSNIIIRGGGSATIYGLEGNFSIQGKDISITGGMRRVE